MLPRAFYGVWRRRSIAFDGGEPVEDSRVLWLQASRYFADVRVPLTSAGTVEAFAGCAAWESPRLTWHHVIDWHGGFAAFDRGGIAWCGELMIERGTTGAHTYEEVWERADDGATRFVAIAEDAILVQVGAYCIAMHDARRHGGRFGARSARRDADAGWLDLDVLGDGAGLPRPDEVPLSWTIIEQT